MASEKLRKYTIHQLIARIAAGEHHISSTKTRQLEARERIRVVQDGWLERGRETPQAPITDDEQSAFALECRSLQQLDSLILYLLNQVSEAEMALYEARVRARASNGILAGDVSMKTRNLNDKELLKMRVARETADASSAMFQIEGRQLAVMRALSQAP